MKRLGIVYGGVEYSLGNREPAEVRAEIDGAIISGRPYWFSADRGEGRLDRSMLLITPGVSFALTELNAFDEEAQ